MVLEGVAGKGEERLMVCQYEKGCGAGAFSVVKGGYVSFSAGKYGCFRWFFCFFRCVKKNIVMSSRLYCDKCAGLLQ